MTHTEWLKTVTSDSQRAVARRLNIDSAQLNREIRRGLDADRVIQISYAYGLDPVRALQETGHLHYSDSGHSIDQLLDRVMELAQEIQRLKSVVQDDDDGLNENAA